MHYKLHVAVMFSSVVLAFVPVVGENLLPWESIPEQHLVYLAQVYPGTAPIYHLGQSDCSKGRINCWMGSVLTAQVQPQTRLKGSCINCCTTDTSGHHIYIFIELG